MDRHVPAPPLAAPTGNRAKVFVSDEADIAPGEPLS